MKTIFLILSLFTSPIVFACDVCKKQQPKILQGITHGTGPQSNWDYVIVTAVALLVAFTLYFSIKCMIIPKERSTSHIKYFVLNND